MGEHADNCWGQRGIWGSRRIRSRFRSARGSFVQFVCGSSLGGLGHLRARPFATVGRRVTATANKKHTKVTDTIAGHRSCKVRVGKSECVRVGSVMF